MFVCVGGKKNIKNSGIKLLMFMLASILVSLALEWDFFRHDISSTSKVKNFENKLLMLQDLYV